MLKEQFPQLLAQVFDYANRPETLNIEDNLRGVLGLPTPADQDAALAVYRQLREYIAAGKNNVWRWYIANLIQPLRLANLPVARLVGNPPWVVYNAMADDRQDTFRQHASDRSLWAGANLATQSDLAATFVATCVDYYLQPGGKFGFVLPYAAMRARHWANFLSGNWSLRQDTERGTHVDLSEDAWDFYGVQAPFSTDGFSLTEGIPSGDDAARFRLYWDNADRDWREGSGGRPPHTLVDRLNYSGGLVSQLTGGQSAKVVYQRSGSWLQS